MTRIVEVLATMLELPRVLAVLWRIEHARRRGGPKPLLEKLRQGGRQAPHSGARGRQRLRRAIGWVDARMPGGGNCYRRALLEIALDPDAAGQPLQLGFHLKGDQVAGHAWLAPAAGAEPYHIILQV